MSIIADYVENLMPSSVISRPLAGETPTVELVVGFRRDNKSEALKLFVSRLNEIAFLPPA